MSTLHTTLAPLVTNESVREYLTKRDLPCPDDHEKAISLAIRSSGASSQGEVAGLVVNLTKAVITGAQLTEVLKAAFPTDKVGDRHGPYYLSLCRTGKIAVDHIPGKKVAAAKAESPDPRIAALETELEQLKARIAAALACTSAKDIKAALNG